MLDFGFAWDWGFLKVGLCLIILNEVMFILFKLWKE